MAGNSFRKLPNNPTLLRTNKKLEHHEEEMFIQEIDLDLLKDSEKSYKLRDDLILK